MGARLLGAAAIAILFVAGIAPAHAQNVNRVELDSAPTGSNPTIFPIGPDANLSLVFLPKGTGGVGIGTASPASRLQVYDTANTNLDSVIFGRLVTGTSTSVVPVSQAQLALGGNYNIGYNGTQSPTPIAVKLWIGAYDNDGGVVDPIYSEDENNSPDFWVRNKSSESGRSTAYFQGNVGIGTAAPAATLDVNGFARLKNNAVAPATCAAGIKGSIALTSATRMCVCDGTDWTEVNSVTACTW